eukprot:8715114-Heterocapsa_arctica.AAC.1
MACAQRPQPENTSTAMRLRLGRTDKGGACSTGPTLASFGRESDTGTGTERILTGSKADSDRQTPAGGVRPATEW